MTANRVVAPRYVDPIERLAVALWVRLPRRVIRRLPGAWGIAGDGHPLVALPPVAVLAPVLVPLYAFAAGATHLGYEQVYTESLAILVATVAIGAFSSQLGLLAVAGLTAGELLLGPEKVLQPFARFSPGDLPDGPAETLLRVYLPIVIVHLLLAVAVVVVPRTARVLVVAVGRWRRIPLALAWPVGSGLFVAVVWIGLTTWVAAAPTLVRPRFTWLGGQPTVEAIENFQQHGSTIVAVGVLAAIARQVLVGLALWWRPVRDRVALAEATPVPDAARAAGGATPVAPGPARRLVGDLGAAAVATLVLAGVLEETWVWVVTFTTFLGVRVLRSGILPLPPLAAWQRLVALVPAVLRAIVLWVVARVVTDALVGGLIESYTGMALVIVGGAVVVFVLFPGNPRPASAQP